MAIGREFARKAQENVINVAPEAGRPIADLEYLPGRPVRHEIDEDAFVDADPGDVLYLSARLADGRALPRWLVFDAKSRRFTGQPPQDFCEELRVVVVANDVDGLEASSTFVVRRAIGRPA